MHHLRRGNGASPYLRHLEGGLGTAMAASSGCGDAGQDEQAIAERLGVCSVDYGPDTLTFRRGSSWGEA